MNESNKDLIKFIESIPYGEVSIGIKRVNRKTVEIITIGEETLKYENNDEAITDLVNMVQNLISLDYSGEATVKLTLNSGKIKLLSIFHKKETKY